MSFLSSVQYAPLSTSEDSSRDHDLHLHVTNPNLHRTRSGRSPSPRPKLTLSTDEVQDNTEPRYSPTLGSASKERFNVHLGRAGGVLGRFRRALWDLYQKNVGLLLIGASTLTGTAMVTVVKLLTNQDAAVSDADLKAPHLPTSELIAVRMLITLIVAEAWMWYKRVPYPILGPPGVRGWLNFRGITGFVALFGAYYSVQYISLSDSTVIGFLSPFATAFLGRIILKEAFSKKEAYAAIASFFGVILIARPSFLFGHPTEIDPNADTHHVAAGSADGGIVHGLGGSSQNHIEQSEKMRLIAVCISLLGVASLSLAFISMRRLKDSIHVMHSVIYFTTWSLIISTFSAVLSNVIPGIPEASKIVWLWPDFKQLMGIIAIGIFGFIGQVLVTMGFQKEAAGRGTLALYIAIVFSLISERIFFHHQPGALSFFGIAIILSSAIYVVLSKTSDNSTPPTTEADEEVGLMPIGSESEDDDGEATLRGDESSERLPKVEGLK